MTTQQTFSPTLGALAAALAKAQAVIEGAKEEAVNPYFKSKYADLASVWSACKKPLTANGLSVIQTVENGGETAYLVTMLLHISGEWIRSFMPIYMTKKDPQSFGSAITYCRRYALAAIVGVCPADDDGEAAQGRDAAKKEAPAAPKTISKMQIDEIETLLRYREDVREKLLDWASIDFIKDLPIDRYTKAIENVRLALKEEPK